MKQKRILRRTKKQMTACNRNFAIMQTVGICTTLRNKEQQLLIQQLMIGNESWKT